MKKWAGTVVKLPVQSFIFSALKKPILHAC